MLHDPTLTLTQRGTMRLRRTVTRVGVEYLQEYADEQLCLCRERGPTRKYDKLHTGAMTPFSKVAMRFKLQDSKRDASRRGGRAFD